MTVNHNPPIHHHGFITILIIFSLMFRPAFSDSPGGSNPNTDNDPYLAQQKFSPSMGIIIIVLIAALFFMGFFSIYIRHCTGASTASGGASRRGIIGSVARSVRGPRGLDPAVVESFPTFTYSAVKELKIGKGALECAVCLLEFEDDETLRLIPQCDHVFHPDCIDQWLVGHTTCPVCRSNLADPSALIHAPPNFAIQNDAVVEECDSNPRTAGTDDEEENNSDGRENSMEEPMMMSRNRTIRRSGSIGRPRWLGRLNFTRSFSTGHMAVKQWERFTLRLPEEVRKQLMSGKLQLERTTSLVVLPRETSSRRGYRAGFGSVRVDRGGFRSDRWAFSLAPPFFTKAPSVRSPKVAAEAAMGSRQGSTRLPV